MVSKIMIHVLPKWTVILFDSSTENIFKLIMADTSEYKVGVVLSVENCGQGGNKALKACKVNVGDTDNLITVVTAATNVREGSRLAVAVVGTKVIGGDGEEITIQKTTVGGVVSDGMFCDSRMLGWIGGAEGIAQQIPDSIEIGSPPPLSKPRGHVENNDKSTSAPSVDVKPLFEKKLTKEEKKKLAEERRKSKKATKDSQDTESTET